MEFNKNESGSLGGAATADALSPIAGEIDLYAELLTFAELPPEEQRRLPARPQEPVLEALKPPADSIDTHNTDSQGEIEAIEPEAGTDTGADDSSEVTAINSKDSKNSRASGSLAVDTTAQTRSKEATENPDLSDPVRQLFDRSRTGPLLAGLNVPDSLFAGDLSLGTCLACGAESGADDLFCVSCGVFIDDIGSTPAKSDPTCADCGQKVTTDEIFCPWCGAPPS